MTIKLSKIDTLFDECEELGINIVSELLPSNVKGLYYSDEETEPVISIDSSIEAQSEACCVIAEELGHYFTSSGNLITGETNNTIIQQQESRAKRWAYEKLVPLDKLIQAYESGVRNRHELALYLDVIEDFLEASINYYKEKYGLFHSFGNYIIYFEPLGIYKMFV